MKRERLIKDIFQGLLMVAVAAIAMPDLAFAALSADLGTASTNLVTAELTPAAPVISALFWLGGAVMMGAGALKLKEHAENPTQNPLRQGISRMAVGAVLVTIPFFASFAVQTLGAGDAAQVYTPWTI